MCGANCTTQSWVTTIPDGQLLLSIDPVPGGGVISLKVGSILQDPHPPLRTILPDYQPPDSACCPSQYADTTYTWEQRRGALLAGAPSIIAAADLNGWDDVRAGLQADGFFDVFPYSSTVQLSGEQMTAEWWAVPAAHHSVGVDLRCDIRLEQRRWPAHEPTPARQGSGKQADSRKRSRDTVAECGLAFARIWQGG